MPSELSTMARECSGLAVMPWTQFTRRLLTAFSIVNMEVNSAKVITGSITLSCNCPAEAAKVTVRSVSYTHLDVYKRQVLHLARDAEHEAQQQRTVAALGLPPEIVQFVDANSAGKLLGRLVSGGGWWLSLIHI